MNKSNNIKNNKFLLILLISILTSSCTAYYGKKNQPHIRIVDLQGNAKPIKTYVPEGNIKILAQQQNQQITQLNNNQTSNIENDYQNPSQIIQQKFLAKEDNQDQTDQLYQQQEFKEKVLAKTDQASINEEKVSFDMSANKVEELPQKKEEISVENNNKSTDEDNKKYKFKIGKENQSAKKAIKDNINDNKMFIQIGSFTIESNAKSLLSRNQNLNAGQIQEAKLGDKIIYKVLLGPVENRKDLILLLNKARNVGHKDAFIVK